MTANVKFVVAPRPDTPGNDQYCYALVFDSNMNVISSNYYDNDTANRGDAANLVVSSGCVIYLVYANYKKKEFGEADCLTVSDINSLPNDGIISLYFVTNDSGLKRIKNPQRRQKIGQDIIRYYNEKPGPKSVAFDLSSQVGSKYVSNPNEIVATLPILVVSNIRKYVTPITNDNYSQCVYPENIIIGNMGTALQAQEIGQYYDRENICVPMTYPTTMFYEATNYGPIRYEYFSGDGSGSSINWFLIIVFIILAIVFVMYFGKKILDKRLN